MEKSTAKRIAKEIADRIGVPSLEDHELTDEQKKFAILAALGVAQDQCDFSEYQKKQYLVLPKMQEEIKKWKIIFKKDWCFKKLIKAIEILADKINSDIKADEALKYTQAAQNAANTMRCLSDFNYQEK